MCGCQTGTPTDLLYPALRRPAAKYHPKIQSWFFIGSTKYGHGQTEGFLTLLTNKWHMPMPENRHGQTEGIPAMHKPTSGACLCLIMGMGRLKAFQQCIKPTRGTRLCLLFNPETALPPLPLGELQSSHCRGHPSCELVPRVKCMSALGCYQCFQTHLCLLLSMGRPGSSNMGGKIDLYGAPTHKIAEALGWKRRRLGEVLPKAGRRAIW